VKGISWCGVVRGVRRPVSFISFVDRFDHAISSRGRKVYCITPLVVITDRRPLREKARRVVAVTSRCASDPPPSYHWVGRVSLCLFLGDETDESWAFATVGGVGLARSSAFRPVSAARVTRVAIRERESSQSSRARSVRACATDGGSCALSVCCGRRPWDGETDVWHAPRRAQQVSAGIAGVNVNYVKPERYRLVVKMASKGKLDIEVSTLSSYSFFLSLQTSG